jgi:hypothetical protein
MARHCSEAFRVATIFTVVTERDEKPVKYDILDHTYVGFEASSWELIARES